MGPLVVVFLFALNVRLLSEFYLRMFGSWEHFWQCVGYWFRPDILSWLSGEYGRDKEAEFRLGLAMAATALLVYLDYRIVEYADPRWVKMMLHT